MFSPVYEPWFYGSVAIDGPSVQKLLKQATGINLFC